MATIDQILTDEQQGREPDKSFAQRKLESIKEGWDELRIGDGHMEGMGRLGGHEITQALAAFPDSNIRPMEEPGVFGNATPQIITEQMGFESVLDSYAARGSVHGREEERGLER